MTRRTVATGSSLAADRERSERTQQPVGGRDVGPESRPSSGPGDAASQLVRAMWAHPGKLHGTELAPEVEAEIRRLERIAGR